LNGSLASFDGTPFFFTHARSSACTDSEQQFKSSSTENRPAACSATASQLIGERRRGPASSPGSLQGSGFSIAVLVVIVRTQERRSANCLSGRFLEWFIPRIFDWLSRSAIRVRCNVTFQVIGSWVQLCRWKPWPPSADIREGELGKRPTERARSLAGEKGALPLKPSKTNRQIKGPIGFQK
jgi:hypothetical protein